MLPPTQRRVLLARPLSGVPTAQDFTLVDGPVAEPDEGACTARVRYLSLDPYLRSAMAGRHIGHTAVPVGGLVPGRGIAEVVRSRRADLAVGDVIEVETGWQEWVTTSSPLIRKLDPSRARLSAYLGVLGMPGLTGWVAVAQLMRPVPGDTVVVSAPLGPVGSTAAQVARLAGCRVVGLSSSFEKCARAVSDLGYGACINYRDAGWTTALADACPHGVDGYLDNAGGDILEGVLGCLRTGARVVLCGLMDQYNTGVVSRAPLAPLIRARAHLMGLVVYDHMQELAGYARRAEEWMKNGTLKMLEDRAEGLAAAPEAFHRLMRGANVGKALVVMAPEPAQ
jgi:NADPH-dependent curcumin reductase CurA